MPTGLVLILFVVLFAVLLRVLSSFPRDAAADTEKPRSVQTTR